jgi:two-component system, NarL family, nitrate/nitrite response regulator NarL
MSGDLLANALIQGKRCEAATIPSTDLMRVLSKGEVHLVVIGAEVEAESGDGFELARAVGRAYPNISIVILLNSTTQEAVINAFRSGARGVFSRQQPAAEFFDCVEHVRKGLIWAGREETNSLLEAVRCIPSIQFANAQNSASLTARELQVVRCAARGKTNKAIANELSLSEHTIKNYLFRAFDKLGVSSRVELLFFLTSQGHVFNGTTGDAPAVDRSAKQV